MATATHLREIVTIIPRTRGRLLPLVFRRWCVLAIMVYQYFLSRGKRTRRSSEGRGMFPAASYISPSRVTISSSSASVLVGSIGRVLHDANIHRLINRYTNCLSCFVVDEARRTFKEDIVRVLEDIELAKRLQRVMAAALHLDGKFIAPAPRQPYSLLGRFEVAVLADEERIEPLRGAVGLLVGRDLVAVGEVVQVDSGAVGEAHRGPLPRLGQEVAPLAVDPSLPGHVDLAPDAVLSGVSDPANDLDTRQRIIVAPILPCSLLNEALDAELVLRVHHLLRTCKTQIVGQLRGCDRQVHGVAFVGPLGAVGARRE